MSSTNKPHIPADPKPQHSDNFWLEPIKGDDRVKLENNNTVVKGQLGGRIYVAHANATDKTTRYWFKVNPGSNKICDFKIGAHHLSNDIDEHGNKEWYIDDNWTVNIATGAAVKETYVQDKEDYMKEEKTVSGLRAKGQDVLMVELKGASMSIWLDDKEVARNIFTDKELNGPNVHICVDFEKTDGDSVHYFGYDELEANAPAYKPAVAGKPTTQPRPAP